MTETERKKPWSTRKKAFLVLLVIASGAIIVLTVLGGYTPFYRTFLQAEKMPYYADHIKGVEGIEYVARINEGLYRGAYPKENLDQLKKLGVKTIINLRYLKVHDYSGEARAAGFEYYWMPINPPKPPDKKFVEKFLSIVTDQSKQPVYFHCTMGIDRTGLMAGIYRIEEDGWSNEKAVAEMEYFGHNELWHDLEETLKTYTGPESYKHSD